MTRKLCTSALALVVALASGFAAPAHTAMVPAAVQQVAWTALAWQAQQVSRWQADRFGPIVSSDTMWTIGTYYGRQHGVSVYQMMDAIVAANPRVFIDNRPDRMMDGYYLVIPPMGDTAQQALVKPQAQPEQVQQTADSGDTVQFKADELRDLRDRLAGSIEMIEQLQSENSVLQSRLKDVTAELEALKVQLAEDRAIDQEIDALAGELVTQVPAVEGSQERVLDHADTVVTEQPRAEQQVSEQQAQQLDTPVATNKPAAVNKGRPNFIDWLLQPPQLYVLIAVPILLLLLLLYMAYVRRIKQEFEQQSEPPQQAQQAEQPELQSEQSAPAHEDIDANSVVTGLAAVTGAAVAVEAIRIDHDQASELGNDGDDSEQDRLDDRNSLDQERVAEFDLSEFQVASDDPLLGADDDSFYLDDGAAESIDVDIEDRAVTASEEGRIAGLDDDDDFAKLLASLEAPADEDSGIDKDRQPPLAKRAPKLSDEPLSGLSLAADHSADDGDYVSIDTLLNDADSISEGAEDDGLLAVDYDNLGLDAGALDDSKTPAAQLDLAQAYIDMGELDDARALLKKIVGCDDADADCEAALLLQQLDSQSGR